MKSTLEFQARRYSLTAAIGACLILVAPCGVWGQDNAGNLQFEAASVKLHTIATPSTGRQGIELLAGICSHARQRY